MVNVKKINLIADYGAIVTGDRFIGRLDNIRIVESRIINPSKSANLAIIGIPRIGKSSLAWKAIMEREEDLISRKILPIWIDVGIFNEIVDFFCEIIAECVFKLEKLDLFSIPLNEVVKLINDESLLWNKRFSFILKFFKLVKDLGYRIILILDEFDNARNIFKDTAEGFQKLRSLSYNPKYSVSFITTSRRSVKNIEETLKGSSTFYETFMNNNLGAFNENDKNEYFEKISNMDIIFSDDDKDKINKFCGSHPYLLDILNYEIVEIFLKQTEIKIDKAISTVEEMVVNYYDHLINILKEDESLSKLLQILIGPPVDITGADINSLLSYSLIKQINVDEYHAFSHHFQEFLKIINREVDLWPILGETERKLRNVISIALDKHYGENWIKKLEQAPQLIKIFKNARVDQEKEKKTFGARASSDLLDYTYPMDLYSIISREWGVIFKPLFGIDERGKKIQKNYWETRISYISKFRNPLAHHRSGVIKDYERQVVEGYCKEILSFIKHLKGKNKI